MEIQPILRQIVTASTSLSGAIVLDRLRLGILISISLEDIEHGQTNSHDEVVKGIQSLMDDESTSHILHPPKSEGRILWTTQAQEVLDEFYFELTKSATSIDTAIARINHCFTLIAAACLREIGGMYEFTKKRVLIADIESYQLAYEVMGQRSFVVLAFYDKSETKSLAAAATWLFSVCPEKSFDLLSPYFDATVLRNPSDERVAYSVLQQFIPCKQTPSRPVWNSSEAIEVLRGDQRWIERCASLRCHQRLGDLAREALKHCDSVQVEAAINATPVTKKGFRL